MKRTKENFKKIKEDSGLSTVAVVSTAAGAITMALISTKIASSGGSLLLTGLISALAVVINGFYKSIISSMGKTTKKVVTIANNAIIEANGKQPKEILIKNDGTSNIDENLNIEENDEIEKVSDEAVEEKTDAKTLKSSSPKNKMDKFLNFVKKNNFWMMLLLFITISVLTAGISHAVSDEENIINVHNNTTEEVTEIKKQNISEKTKEAIVAEVLEQLEQEENTQNKSEDTSSNNSEDSLDTSDDKNKNEGNATSTSKSENISGTTDNKNIDKIIEDLEESQNKQESQKEEISSLKQELNNSNKTIENLEKKLDKNDDIISEMENRLKELEKTNSEKSSSVKAQEMATNISNSIIL